MNEESVEQKDYLYAVLNLPNTASQNEIRERYRALSVIFHPDKRHDERTTDTALSKFLDIQKAYEVLSDPFLRQVYDRLGSEALKWKWPTELRSKDSEEIKAALNEWDFDRRHETIQQLLHPKASVTCTVNASSLFTSGELGPNCRKILNRIRGVGIAGFGIRQSITTDLGPKSTLTLDGYADQKSLGRYAQHHRGLTGTLKHEYSQRLGLELTAGFFRPHLITSKATYTDGENAVAIHTGFIAPLLHSVAPWITLSFARRLFRHSPTEASVSWTFSPGSYPGRLDLHVHSSKPFDLTSPRGFAPPTDFVDPPFDQGPGSVTGFGAGVRSWSCGLLLRGLESGIEMHYSLFLHELAIRLRAGVEIGLLSAAYSVSAKWTGKRSSFSTSVGIGNLGVFVRFELSYLWQKWTLPIILSPEDETMSLYTLIIPSTALALSYLFILRPRRRKQRARYFECARRALKEERSGVTRAYENTILLLQEPARRHTDAESAIGGLVILEAIYGPRSPDDEIAGLDVDVTIPLQALVHNSQLYVSNRIPKSGIQGFYDPAPGTPKCLRVRYMFRDQMHYAEIPDLVPIVLPLRDHLVM